MRIIRYLYGIAPDRLKLPVCGFKDEVLDRYTTRRSLAISALKGALSDTPVAMGVEIELDCKMARRLGALVQNVLESAEIEQIIDLIPPEVEMDSAIGRPGSLLKEQQALDQRGFS